MIEYKVTFKNFFNGDKVDVTLGTSRSTANEKFKEVRRNFSWWWRAGIINCE
jgi:hypothetical protein